ncbi:carbon catabolite repressor protein 4 homolog 4 isoform X2 [Ziziphus jujuba]|uniref:Carbon catabolite repressor protein 4 homolog 4 isoform X2 n=1 Tax=Ziziphus jujuba TaxID=326968 RepID=A0ABM3I4M8_ZIZJJ|nr:carbon catabolite repressor protein 4 homolog 4 isoform X2 [Ziziphus jujuba]
MLTLFPALTPRLRTFPFTRSRTVLSKMSTTKPSLKFPKFVSVEGSDIFSRSKPGIKFSLVSYNILAQVYVKSSLFPHSPPPCLKWKARSRAVLAILKNLEADFLCLQEVDEYDSFYKGNMMSNGYSSIYIQRSGQKRDGCGIFFKHDSAELILHENIEYNDLVDSIQDENLASDDTKDDKQASKNECVEPKNDSALESTSQDRGDPNDPRVRLKRDCVGVMAAFKLKDSYSHVVIIANTHIYWDPEWADVKLAQAKYLLSRLSQFKTLVSDRFECKPSVVVAGDFNSTPGDKVYEYVVSGNTTSAPMPESLDDLPIPLCSVYASTRGEPTFTNCTPDFTDTLDYIFYSPSDHVKPVSILELPELDSPDVSGGLPNYSYPSDHLPIGAEFEISRT